MEIQNATQSHIIAKVVSNDERLNVLPTYFGKRHMIMVESAIYRSLGDMCQTYQGGYWEFYSLSNGGFYMAPSTDQPLHLSVWGNGFEKTVSADVAGIIASLVGINQALWATHDERLHNRFFELREFAMDHPEGRTILSAID